MEVQLSKIDAAIEELDWAIKLFLDHNAYLPAIVLAGASEEILGKFISSRAVFYQLKTHFAKQFSLPEKVISQNYLNRAKNWLKHWDEQTDDKKISLELEEEALQYIVRALTNLALYDLTQPSEGPRFWAWMARNRPDEISL